MELNVFTEYVHYKLIYEEEKVYRKNVIFIQKDPADQK